MFISFAFELHFKIEMFERSHSNYGLKNTTWMFQYNARKSHGTPRPTSTFIALAIGIKSKALSAIDWFVTQK